MSDATNAEIETNSEDLAVRKALRWRNAGMEEFEATRRESCQYLGRRYRRPTPGRELGTPLGVVRRARGSKERP